MSLPGPEQDQPPPSSVYRPYPQRQPDVVGKAALSTVTVLLVLFGLLCVLPMVLCVGWFAVFGGGPTRP